MCYYNKERKEEYIQWKYNTTTLTPGYLERLFKMSKEFEEQHNKDIADFTENEIIDYYKSLNVSSVDYLYVTNSAYSLYTQWVFEHNLLKDNQNHFSDLKRDILMTCLNVIKLKKRVITRNEVLDWCDELPNAGDAFTILGSFEGLCGKELCELSNAKFSDFHKNDDSTWTFHTCTGRDICVSLKLVGLAEEASEAIKYYSMNEKGIPTPLRNTGDLIIKPTTRQVNDDAYSAYKIIYNRSLKAFAYLGINTWMNLRWVYQSGMVQYIKSLAVNAETTPLAVIKNIHTREMIEKQYDVKIKAPQRFYNKYKMYFEEQ